MSVRAVPYPEPGTLVRLPRPLWDEAITIVRSYGEIGRGNEALVYFAGVIASDELVITSLYAIDPEPQGGRVVVSPAEARWLLQQLRQRDEKLIAQLHSHETIACHSSGDDSHATSFHPGFISIVVPCFGRGAGDFDQCAVVEFDGEKFRELTREEKQSRVRIIEPVLYRRSGAPVQGARIETVSGSFRCNVFVRKLKSIARRRR